MPSERISRRGVLKASVAACAAPLVIPSSAIGADGETAPSERVALGHLGVGNRGRQVLRTFAPCKNARSVAFADCYKDRREGMAAAQKGKAYADFRELIADESIDAVVIATPDHWHVPLAIAAARAGKDAYVEKPLGTYIDEDLMCLDEFEKAGRVFQYGTQQRSMAHCRFGCELVRSGKIGELKRIEVLAPNGGAGGSTTVAPVPENLDYDMWCGPSPMNPYTADRCHPNGTYWIYDYSIGYLGGWGAHPLDIMVWGADCDQAGPFTIEGTGDIPTEGLYDCVYNWDMTFQMADGVEITLKPGSDSTKFIGTEGWVDVRRAGTTAEPTSLMEVTLGDGDVRLIESASHAQNFVDSVLSREAAVSHVKDAVRSDLISLLCDLCVRTGRKLTWDPAKNEIVGDAEASKLRRRSVREKWDILS